MSSNGMRAYRAKILHFTDKPDSRAGTGFSYYDDGVLLIDGEYVHDVMPASELEASGFDLQQCRHFPDKLIMPGFIDSHMHFPQTDVIASYGEQLLDWLNNYTFPCELRFSDRQFAVAEADAFFSLLLENGTTTAMVYTTVFPQSTDAFFEAAAQRNLRMIAGKVMMDRNAPDGLLDTPASAALDTRQLIERWHGQKRLSYALTPRFAPTSSPEQLAACGAIYRDYPDIYLQTHLSENLQEIAWIKELYPQARDYLDVYDHFGLLGSRSVFGHGIHLSDAEIQRLAETGSGVAFCPTSNFFLGSGLLNLARLESAGVPVSIATDVGGGTSFSLLRTLAEAYKVLQLQQQSLHPLKALYMATLGNARALQLDHCIGNFLPGKEADFIVLDLAPDTLQKKRQQASRSLDDVLFALMMLGDTHNVANTFIAGREMFCRHPLPGEMC